MLTKLERKMNEHNEYFNNGIENIIKYQSELKNTINCNKKYTRKSKG